jgi:cytoskeletal protein RodZ
MQLKDISTNHLLNVIAILIVLISGYIVLKLFRQNTEIETFIEGAVYKKNPNATPTQTAKPVTIANPTITPNIITTTRRPVTIAKPTTTPSVVITTKQPVTIAKPTTTPSVVTTTKQPIKLATTTFAPTDAPTKYTTTAAGSATIISPLQDEVNALKATVAILQKNCATKAEVANNLVKGTDYTQKINGKVVSTAKISLN